MEWITRNDVIDCTVDDAPASSSMEAALYTYACTRDDKERTQLALIHLMIVSAVLVMTLMLYRCISHIQDRRLTARVKSLPDSELTISKDFLGKRMALSVLKEAGRAGSRATEVLPCLAVTEPNWGSGVDSEETIHYKRHIASSALVIEATVRDKYPELVRRSSMDMYEYLACVAERCPSLRMELCNGIAEQLEVATYSSHVFTTEQYRDFDEMLTQFCDDIGVAARRQLSPTLSMLGEESGGFAEDEEVSEDRYEDAAERKAAPTRVLERGGALSRIQPIITVGTAKHV